MSKELRKKLKKDDTFQRFQRIVANCSQTNLDEVLKEVESLHAGRSMRNLRTVTVSAKKVIKAATEDSSYRSRLVELNMTMTREFNTLKLAFDTTRDYLNSHYGKEIGVRSISDRDTYWRSMLRKAVSRIQELEGAIDLTDSVIEDIDKASFTTKHIIDALNIVTRPEYQA